VKQIVILGSTASGKSDVAMALGAERAEHGDIEIVAVDAMQVYRGMDIGTAKPSLADQAAVPHRCIDLVGPHELFTVAEFQREARAALAGIAQREHIAVLVAGTGMYLTAVIDNFTLPGEWPAIRAELEAVTDISELYARLIEIDPAAAAKIEPANQRRLVRALEVCLGSGKLFSSFGPGATAFPEIPAVQIGLRWPRDLLAQRVEQRVHAMIERGLVNEVRSLLESSEGLSRTARQALGYRELIAALEGTCSIDQAVAEIIVRTRQFAVRQERWFRRDPRIQWVDITADPVAEVLPIVRQHLA